MDLDVMYKILLAILAYFAVLAVGIGSAWLMNRKSRKGESHG